MKPFLGFVTLSLLVFLGVESRCRAGEPASDREVLQVLDDFMTAFNARDRKKQAATFHFPHVRIFGDNVLVFKDAAAFAKHLELEKVLTEAGWSRSAWDSRKVIQRSATKAHVAVRFTRYKKSGEKIGTYQSIYVVTKKDGRWGIRARSSFAP